LCTTIIGGATGRPVACVGVDNGDNAVWAEARACPCANFSIQVIPDEERKLVVIPAKTQAAQPGKSPVNPFTVITALAVSGFLCWVTVLK
jgi:hypothetical protein